MVTESISFTSQEHVIQSAAKI